VQDLSMTSWPLHLPFGNQKRFGRDPEQRAGVIFASQSAA
jgi:hypothetical protein